MIVYIVLVAVLIQFETEAYTLKDFSTKLNLKINNKEQEKKLSLLSKSSLKNILGEIGTKPIYEEFIYNQTEPMKLCWADILYVNESNGAASSWHEYQVSIYSPAEAYNLTTPKKVKKYRDYALEMPDGTIKPEKFEEVYHGDYIISKQVNLTCGQGKFLGKSYQQWSHEKNIVVRLSQKSLLETSDQSKLVSLQDSEDGSDEVLQSSPPVVDMIMSTLEEEIATKSAEFEDFEVKTTASLQMQNESLSDNRVATTPRLWKKNDEKFNSPNDNKTKDVAENSTWFDDLLKVNLTTSVKEAVPKVSSCSPLLTQLFSGHLILPGLCNMTKNDKIILQGDIFVSLKRSDNQIEPKPLFVIHENTEIESTLEKDKETTTPLLNLIID